MSVRILARFRTRNGTFVTDRNDMGRYSPSPPASRFSSATFLLVLLALLASTHDVSLADTADSARRPARVWLDLGVGGTDDSEQSTGSAGTVSTSVATRTGATRGDASPLSKRPLSERTRLIVGRVLCSETGIPYGNRVPRPRRITRVSIALSELHQHDAGRVVEVITHASLWNDGGTLLLTTTAGTPQFLVRPGELVAVHVEQSRFFGEGTELAGSWNVRDFWIVRGLGSTSSDGELWSAVPFPDPGPRIREHFASTGDIDLALLDYEVTPTHGTLRERIAELSAKLGIDAPVLLTIPDGGER